MFSKVGLLACRKKRRTFEGMWDECKNSHDLAPRNRHTRKKKIIKNSYTEEKYTPKHETLFVAWHMRFSWFRLKSLDLGKVAPSSSISPLLLRRRYKCAVTGCFITTFLEYPDFMIDTPAKQAHVFASPGANAGVVIPA